MTEHTGGTTALLHGVQEGDEKARNRLIGHACERLRSLASWMLGCFPAVKRWEQTDDVLQEALCRLDRALYDLVPKSSRHFWNLAALQIRRELLDLARRYSGPQGLGANHHSDPDGRALERQTSRSGEPSSPAEWEYLLETVQALPEAEREVVDLLFCQALTQEDAAEQVGVSVRTLRRLWQSARLRLAAHLTAEPRR